MKKYFHICHEKKGKSSNFSREGHPLKPKVVGLIPGSSSLPYEVSFSNILNPKLQTRETLYKYS